MKTVSAAEAAKQINSGDRVFIHSVAAAPQQLIHAMVDRHEELNDVEVIHLHIEGDAPYTDEKYRGSFKNNNLFVGSNVRHALETGMGDYIPVFLSETPYLFRHKHLSLEVALIQVSEPDKHGFCSLGVSIDATRAAIEMADKVIAQVNPNMPRTHGDGLIHCDEIDFCVNVDDPILETGVPQLGETELAIGKNIAEIVDDGATLQMGIGAIPDAVLAALKNHKNLGIHTEMFSDGLIDLVESGVVNGHNKAVHPGKIVSTFVMGTNRLYEFVDDNPQVAMLDVAYVNDTAVIRRNPKVTAINSAIEVDITGQVCADSIGTRQYSGVGGQMDFIRGAGLSEGGKPIIALPSVTRRGETRIVPLLKPGASVVTTRAHVHYIVTEYGVADLYGKNLRQRAKELINIAHPDHREELERQAYERFNTLEW
jgi:acyl-CoA hydrolase